MYLTVLPSGSVAFVFTQGWIVAEYNAPAYCEPISW